MHFAYVILRNKYAMRARARAIYTRAAHLTRTRNCAENRASEIFHRQPTTFRADVCCAPLSDTYALSSRGLFFMITAEEADEKKHTQIHQRTSPAKISQKLCSIFRDVRADNPRKSRSGVHKKITVSTDILHIIYDRDPVRPQRSKWAHTTN